MSRLLNVSVIPDDPDGCCWREATFTGPHALDSALISLIAFGPDGPSLIGTGFLVAAIGRKALALTAAHNFRQAARVQRPWTTQHPTTPAEFTLRRPQTLSTRPKDIRAVYFDKSQVDMCIIGEVSAVDGMDIALFTIALQEHVDDNLLKSRFPLDMKKPRRGQRVCILGYADMSLSVDGLEQETRIQMARRLALRQGVITGVYSTGLRQYQWPCFETTIPIHPGMSGSPVIWFAEDGAPAVSCGVACVDFSPDAAWDDYRVAGHSICAQLWPAAGLSVYATLPGQTQQRKTTVLDFIRHQVIDDRGDATNNISLTQHTSGIVTVRVRN